MITPLVSPQEIIERLKVIRGFLRPCDTATVRFVDDTIGDLQRYVSATNSVGEIVASLTDESLLMLRGNLRVLAAKIDAEVTRRGGA